MQGNPTDQALIIASFERLRVNFDRDPLYFYEALFRHAPELRSMFRDDLTGQGMKFMTTLAEIVENLETPENMADRYAELGEQHASLGVTAAHFAPMREALIDTLRNALGDDFTPELEGAWRRAYDEFSDTMIKAGGIPPA